MIIMWSVCGILTVAGAFSKERSGWGYLARTDLKFNALSEAPVFKTPYVIQWGKPIVSTNVLTEYLIFV